MARTLSKNKKIVAENAALKARSKDFSRTVSLSGAEDGTEFTRDLKTSLTRECS